MSGDRPLIKSLLDLEIPNSISFSPDGQQLIYSTGLLWGHTRDGKTISNLWHARSGIANSSRKLTPSDFSDRAPAWHPDGKQIGFVSDRAQPGRSSAIYLLSVDSGDSSPRAVTPTEHQQYISDWAFSPDGKSIAYISADDPSAEEKDRDANVNVWGENLRHPRLRIVNLENGEIRSLQTDRTIWQFCWSPDGKQIGISTSTMPDLEDMFVRGSKISIVDCETMSLAQEYCQLPKDIRSLIWAADGAMYFHTGVPIHQHCAGTGVYRTHPASLSQGPSWVSYGLDDDVAELKEANGKAIARLEVGLESRLCLLEGMVLYAEEQELEAFDVVFAGGKTTVAVATSNVNQPTEVFTMVQGSNERIQISNHGEAMASCHFGNCNFLKVASADKQCEFDAMYLTPSGSPTPTQLGPPSTPLPTVILIHGGPNTRLTNSFYAYYFALVPYLLSQDYGVLIPNYRGSSGRGCNFSRLVFDAIGKNDYADVITSVQFAIEQGYADRDRLVVGGYSHGGFLTLCSSLRNGMHELGWEFKAAFAGASFSDSDSMALSSDVGALYPRLYFEDRVSWTMDRDDTRNRMASPIWEFRDAVARSKSTGEMVVPPLLLFHGEKDMRCHISQAWGISRAMQSYGLPFEFVTYPTAGHFSWDQRAVTDLVLRLGGWCDKHIGKI